jgi:hypothetical protein
VLGVDDQVPGPDGGVEPAGECDDALRPADPGLGVLDAEVLLEVAIGVLDSPAVGVAAGHLGWRYGGVGGDEEVVALVAGGVADDDEQEGSRARVFAISSRPPATEVSFCVGEAFASDTSRRS